MVLLARSIASSISSSSSSMLSRSILAASRSSLRSFHNVSRTSSPLRASSLRPSVQGCSSTGLPQQSLRAQQLPPSVRLLTTNREKVKVLAVLYDGGKHGEEVRSTLFSHFPLTPLCPGMPPCLLGISSKTSPSSPLSMIDRWPQPSPVTRRTEGKKTR